MYLPPFPVGWEPARLKPLLNHERVIQLRDNARLALGLTLEALVWAIAITLTAGRLARKVYEALRPRLAQLCFNLAARLDPAAPLYPEQPEPPAPAPKPSSTRSRKRR